jgi:diguanylate cyclase (GGDEF)-like protein
MGTGETGGASSHHELARLDRRLLATTLSLVARPVTILLAPGAAGLLRLFPPLGLDVPGAPLWLGAAISFTACAAAALATLLLLVDGLRAGILRTVIASAAFGSLAVGLAVSGIRAMGNPLLVANDGLAPAALVATALLLAAAAVPELRVLPGAPRVGAALAVFAFVEGALATAALATPTTGAFGGPMLLAGVALATVAAVVFAARNGHDRWAGIALSSGLLAGSLIGLAAARPGTIDVLPPLVGMLATGLAASWPGRPDATAGHRVVSPPTYPAEPLTPVRLARGSPPGPVAGSDPEETLRLARELRGTIEELMQAHRTIELQREEIARAAAVDPLTGVASRRAIIERLHIEAASARRYSHPVAVVILDIDGFAELNRERGLAIGDAVLRELALRLRLRIRAADALGRAGGDSFLAILPHTDERGATVFADALRRRIIGRPLATPAGELAISISIGVAIMRPGMELSDDELLAAADEALASAKAAGGNRIAFDRLHGLARIDERRRGRATQQDKGQAGEG